MSDNKTLSMSILSGKGGVGKSNLALNICFALHQQSHPVLLVDCDMGLANMDVLLGIAPQQHLQDILINNRNPAEVLVPVGNMQDTRFDLMPANSGMAEFAELDSGARAILKDKISPLAAKYEYLCLDIGAGISPTAMGFAAMTSVRLVIITPEPTSLTDSYAMMKVLSTRHKVEEFHIIVNQAEHEAEAKHTYKRLAAACERFLGITPHYLGEVRTDKNVSEAVRKQKPFAQLYPLSPASVDCMALANSLQRLRESMLRKGLMDAPLNDITISDY